MKQFRGRSDGLEAALDSFVSLGSASKHKVDYCLY
jgi:hypothetical protein